MMILSELDYAQAFGRYYELFTKQIRNLDYEELCEFERLNTAIINYAKETGKSHLVPNGESCYIPAHSPGQIIPVKLPLTREELLSWLTKIKVDTETINEVMAVHDHFVSTHNVVYLSCTNT